MKTLTILRHAKSSWEYPELSDFDRPLLNKGVKRTLLVCNALIIEKFIPDLIISSPAVRALETASIVIDRLNLNAKKPEINKLFYPGYSKTFVKVISKVEDNVNNLMIVAHNPGLTDLANLLLPTESIEWIPTSGLVQIEFDCDSWNRINQSNASLKKYLVPKKLKNK